MHIQLICSVSNLIIGEGSYRAGDTFWVTGEKRARELVEAGMAQLFNLGPKEYREVGPQEQPVVGPAERKKLLRRSRQWPIDRFSEVTDAWKGLSVVIICSGPSVTEKDLIAARRADRCIVVNDNYLIVPWADVLYFADWRWWQWHTQGIEKKWAFSGMSFGKTAQREAFNNFAGQKVTIENTGSMISDPSIHMLHNAGSDGLSSASNAIYTGSNSGYQALNIAVLSGATKIFLLGYDMKFNGNRTHSHDGHPIRDSEQLYLSFAARYHKIAQSIELRGASVINCSKESAIKCFPRGDLESLLPDPGSAVVSA